MHLPQEDVFDTTQELFNNTQSEFNNTQDVFNTTQELFMSRKWNTNSVKTTIKLVIYIAIIFGNGLLLSFIIKRRKLFLIPNMLIFSLTIADFLNGAFSGSLLLYISYFDQSQIFCITFQVYAYLLFYASSFSVTAIAIDRYIKLKYPLYHRTTWSRFRYRIKCVAVTWMASLILAEIRHVMKLVNPGRFIVACIFRDQYTTYEQAEPTIVILGVNIVSLVLYIKIVTHLNNEAAASGSIRKHVGQYKPKTETIVPKIKVQKSTITLGFIVIFNFIFVAAPPTAISVTLILDGVKGDIMPPEEYVEMISWWYLTSSAVNPYIFALMNKPFKNYLRSFFCRQRYQHPVSSSNSPAKV